MSVLIFLVTLTGAIVALAAHQQHLEAKRLHHDRIDLLSNRHISIDQVLEEIMNKDI